MMIYKQKILKIYKKESCILDNGACQRKAEKVKELKSGLMDHNTMDILKMTKQMDTAD